MICVDLGQRNNVGTTPARFLVTVVPGGFEKFFVETGKPVTDTASSPVQEGPPDVEKLVATTAKYGCEIPPPPGEQSRPRPGAG